MNHSGQASLSCTLPSVLKNLLALILALLVLVQPFREIWIYVYFKINQDYIAKTLCVKREIKNNTCQGNCQLMKKLAKTEKEENPSIPQVRERAEVQIFCSNQPQAEANTRLNSASSLLFKEPDNSYLSRYVPCIFHPPQPDWSA